MLELLASGGKTRGAMYPDSGPGSKELVRGDETLGYFGELESDDFFTSQELSNLVGVYEGAVATAKPKWVKMMMDGKVLFIPNVHTIRQGAISWNRLYDLGLVYGDGTYGKYPNPAGSVTQDATVSKLGSVFRVRLFGKGDVDPCTEAVNTISPFTSYEFGRFLTAVYKSPDPAFKKSWNLYDINTVVGGSLHTSVTSSANINNLTSRYIQSTSFTRIQYVGKTGNGFWWPVLELLPSDTVVPVKNVGSDVSRILLPIAPGEITTEGEYVKPVINRYGYTTDYLLQGALTELTYEKPADWALPIPASSIRQGSLIPISVSSMTVEQ